jgi:hypothetical protein
VCEVECPGANECEISDKLTKSSTPSFIMFANRIIINALTIDPGGTGESGVNVMMEIIKK